MKLTDKNAIKALRKLRCLELEEMLDEYPENEIEDRTDLEIIVNEVEWLLDLYNSDETCRHDDLETARRILAETKYGKVIPYKFPSLQPLYKPYQIQGAKDLLNEYNRLKRFANNVNYRRS